MGLIEKLHNILKDDGVLITRDSIATNKRIERYNQSDSDSDVIYRTKSEFRDLFFDKSRFELIYSNFSTPPVIIPVSIFKRFVPRKLRDNVVSKFLLDIILDISYFIDKIAITYFIVLTDLNILAYAIPTTA